MNTTEKRNQIIAMLYQNMDKVDADETLKLIDELSTMVVKNNAVLPHVSGSACKECDSVLVHKKEYDVHPYGDNIKYDECIKCGKRHNLKCF